LEDKKTAAVFVIGLQALLHLQNGVGEKGINAFDAQSTAEILDARSFYSLDRQQVDQRRPSAVLPDLGMDGPADDGQAAARRLLIIESGQRHEEAALPKIQIVIFDFAVAPEVHGSPLPRGFERIHPEGGLGRRHFKDLQGDAFPGRVFIFLDGDFPESVFVIDLGAPVHIPEQVFTLINLRLPRRRPSGKVGFAGKALNRIRFGRRDESGEDKEGA